MQDYTFTIESDAGMQVYRTPARDDGEAWAKAVVEVARVIKRQHVVVTSLHMDSCR